MERIITPEEKNLERAKRRVHKIKRFYRHLLVYILVNLFLIITQYINLDNNEAFFQFSTFSTAFFWGIGLIFHAANVFAKNMFLGNNWEERKINEYMNQNQNQKQNSKWE
jgi:hypothetical protein